MREIAGFSAEEMAKSLAVSAKTYARYESSGENIPISALYHMAHMFKVDMSEILTGRSPRIDTFEVVPAGRGVRIDRYPGYQFQGLAYKYMNKTMEPMIVTVDPQAEDPDMVIHAGQEFNYVLEGRILLLFDGKRILLEEGDSVYFNSAHPHGQRAMGDAPARFLTVITEQEAV